MTVITEERQVFAYRHTTPNSNSDQIASLKLNLSAIFYNNDAKGQVGM